MFVYDCHLVTLSKREVKLFGYNLLFNELTWAPDGHILSNWSDNIFNEPFLNFVNCYTYLSDLKIGTFVEPSLWQPSVCNVFSKIIDSDSPVFSSLIFLNQIT